MRTHPRALLFLAVLLATSCSSGPRSPQYDSKQAQQTLVLASGAWKHRRVATLAKGNPAVRFEDEDHRNGLLLADYRLEDPGHPIRPWEDVRVILVLRDPHGKTIEKTAVYQVVLEPGPVVLRND